jgi:hypothetical protein
VPCTGPGYNEEVGFDLELPDYVSTLEELGATNTSCGGAAWYAGPCISETR